MQRCMFMRETHTWEIRLSQPILLSPAAARMMAAKSSFSSSFFSRVLRFPRWERSAQEKRVGRTTPKAGLTQRRRRLEGYDVFKIQMWEPLLQLGGPTQRAGADHATQTQSWGMALTGRARRRVLTVPVGWQSLQSFTSVLWVEHHGIMGVFSPGENRE